MGTADLWHWLLALTAIPVIICAFLIPILAESPKYLHAQGETERAGSVQLEKERQKSNPTAIYSYLIDVRVRKRWSQALLEGATETE